jgi:hypothetical protein
MSQFPWTSSHIESPEIRNSAKTHQRPYGDLSNLWLKLEAINNRTAKNPFHGRKFREILDWAFKFQRNSLQVAKNAHPDCCYHQQQTRCYQYLRNLMTWQMKCKSWLNAIVISVGMFSKRKCVGISCYQFFLFFNLAWTQKKPSAESSHYKS